MDEGREGEYISERFQLEQQCGTLELGERI